MKPKRRGDESAAPVILTFDRKLLAAAATAVLDPNKVVASMDGPMQGIFIDGDRAIATNRNVMTVVYDPNAENEKAELGRMAHGHCCLPIPADLKRELSKPSNGDRVEVHLSEEDATWAVGDGGIIVPACNEVETFPVYQSVIRKHIKRCVETVNSKPVFPLLRIGNTYLTVLETLKALGAGKRTQKDWGVVFYGYGFPVQGVVARYVVRGEISDRIFSLVTGILDSVVQIENPSVTDILPEFMLTPVDGER